jgi:hypothetical protein
MTLTLRNGKRRKVHDANTTNKMENIIDLHNNNRTLTLGNDKQLKVYDANQLKENVFSQYSGPKAMKKFKTRLVNYFTKDHGGICILKKSLDTHNYESSSIGKGYMEYVINNIYDDHTLTTNTERTYYLYVTATTDEYGNDRKNGDFMENIVNVLVYKEGCPKLTKRTSYNPIHLTIICQSKLLTREIDKNKKKIRNVNLASVLTASAYHVLVGAFINGSKEKGYTHVILEVASNAPYDTLKSKVNSNRKYYYGMRASSHLLTRYASKGFIEEPRLALEDKCFDIQYPYNTMILDIKTKGRDGDERLLIMGKILKELSIFANESLSQDVKAKAAGYLKKIHDHDTDLTYKEIHDVYKEASELVYGNVNATNIKKKIDVGYNALKLTSSTPQPSPVVGSKRETRKTEPIIRYGSGWDDVNIIGICDTCGKPKISSCNL